MLSPVQQQIKIAQQARPTTKKSYGGKYCGTHEKYINHNINNDDNDNVRAFPDQVHQNTAHFDAASRNKAG